MNTPRRTFSTLVFGGAGLAALGLTSGVAVPAFAASPAGDGGDPEGWPGFPRQSHDLAQATVGAAHRDLDKVKELVTAHPALANATWDWGFGDWETALGAAAHTGRREIAEFLLASGARIDIYAAAMLGHLEVVKALIEAHPGLQKTRGPHGIPLLAHATAGGEKASSVADYLKSLGDAGETYADSTMTTEQTAVYEGLYTYGADADRQFEIRTQKNQLAFQKGGSPRLLFKVRQDEFHPAGAPAVRFIFDIKPGGQAELTIIDHDLKVTAKRVPRP